MIHGQTRRRARTGWMPGTDPRPGAVNPRVTRWNPVDRQGVAAPWPVRDPSADEMVPPRPWNVAALLSPLLALVCAPAGLCVALVAAGQIGLGRQRGIGFAVAGIVIGSLVPVVVCVWSVLG